MSGWGKCNLRPGFDLPNVTFYEAGVGNLPLALNSQDFGYSLGVLHLRDRAILDAFRTIPNLGPPPNRKAGTFVVNLRMSDEN